MSEAIGATIQQNMQHRSNSRKLNFIMVIIALAAVVVSAVGIFVTVEISKHGVGAVIHTSEFEMAQVHNDIAIK